jgi:hypothetical protein
MTPVYYSNSGTKGHVQLKDKPRSFPRWLLVINRVSNNVGSVKYFLRVRVRALRRARHFALVDALPCQPRPSVRNPFAGQELSPTHASLRSQLRS